MTAKIATPTTKGIGRKRLKARPPKMKGKALQPVVENQFRAARRDAPRRPQGSRVSGLLRFPGLKESSRSLRRHDPDQVPRVSPSRGRLSALLGSPGEGAQADI